MIGLQGQHGIVGDVLTNIDIAACRDLGYHQCRAGFGLHMGRYGIGAAYHLRGGLESRCNTFDALACDGHFVRCP